MLEPLKLGILGVGNALIAELSAVNFDASAVQSWLNVVPPPDGGVADIRSLKVTCGTFVLIPALTIPLSQRFFMLLHENEPPPVTLVRDELLMIPSSTPILPLKLL